MAFDVDKLLAFCTAEIRRFAENHQDELFYAFAVDASLLCLNSEEQFARTLKASQDDWERRTRPIATWDELSDADLRDHDFMLGLLARTSGLDRSDQNACLEAINDLRSSEREKGNPYRHADQSEVRSLRENTGDWAYQGFADMANIKGFDDDAYGEHYDMSDEDQKTSAYGLAMDELVERLCQTRAFACLKKGPTFQATRVEHGY